MDVFETTFFVNNEQVEQAQEALTKGKAKRFRLKKVLLDVLDATNGNKRYYSKKDIPLEKLVEKTNSKTHYLYVDHSWSNQPASEANKLERAGALVDDISWEEITDSKTGKKKTNVYCDLTVLNKGSGAIVQDILEAGGVVGFSKRGTLDHWEQKEIDGASVNVPVGYTFYGYDIVTGQSVAEAMTNTGTLVYEQQETKKENAMEQITLEQHQKNTDVWPEVEKHFEGIYEQKTEDLIKTRVDAAVEEIKSAAKEENAEEAKKMKDDSDKYKKALENVKATLVEIGLVNEKEASAKEQELADKVIAAEEELKTVKAEKEVVEQELETLKNPKPVDSSAVENFFEAKENGKKVLEIATEQGIEFKDETAMKSFYTKVSGLSFEQEVKEPEGEKKEDAVETEEEKEDEAVKAHRERLARLSGTLIK